MFNNSEASSIIEKNREFHNLHHGKRCFILATGSSINKQNLKLLEGEICFAVSNFFVHSDYDLIRPLYYCVPSYHPPIPEENWLSWMASLDKGSKDAIMFFSLFDIERNLRNGLFADRQVHFLNFAGDWNTLLKHGADLTVPVPSPGSSVVMPLMISLYMGFRQIYLLGCDHDWALQSGENVHFYDEKEDAINRGSYDEWVDWEEQFRGYIRLWQQYKAIRHVSNANSIEIYNATAGGLLDVFPRVEFESLFPQKVKTMITAPLPRTIEKILLVNPPARRFVFFQGANFPLGLGYIAAMLEKEGYDVEIYDAEWNPELYRTTPRPEYPLSYMAKNWYKYFDALQNSDHEVWREVENVFKERNPQVIGITARVLDLPSAQALAGIAKKINKEIIVVFGGPAATTCTEMILQDQNIDFVVRHEGEITMPELLKALQSPNPDFHSIDGLSFRESGRIVNNKKRSLIKDIDSLLYPARHLLLYADKLPKGAYHHINAEIITSRGCPYPCTFCANHSVWGSRKARMRKAEDVVEEILYQKNTYGVQLFTFWDDLFIVDRNRVIEICNLLIKKEINVNWICLVRADTVDEELLNIMKEAGCIEVQVGIESGNDRVLKKMRKGITVETIKKAAIIINRVGLRWRAFFLIGVPSETKEEMEDTMRIIHETQPHAAELSVFAPYPGSELYEEVKEKGLINEDEKGWLHADFLNLDYCYVETLPREEFRKLAIEYLNECDIYNNDKAIRNSPPVLYFKNLAEEIATQIYSKTVLLS